MSECAQMGVRFGRFLCWLVGAGALSYFAVEVEGVDPSWANLFGDYHSRFGLEALDARGLLERRL